MGGPQEDEAARRLADADDGLQPVVTVEEAAELLGVTREALAQAMSRVQRADQRGRPHAVTTTGRTRWYDPRKVRPWWHARPGHGPGRGRRA